MESFNVLEGTIEAVTQPKEYQGKLQIGFMMGKLWYNIQGSQEELDIILSESIRKGNKIQFLYDAKTKTLKDLKLTQQAEFAEQQPPAEDGQWADEMVRFEDLLQAAHDKDVPFSIKTEALNIDLQNKYALFKATVEVDTEVPQNEAVFKQTFTAHGDATNENIQGAFIKPHFIRMAETRAIARALRWYTNNAKVSDAELSNGEKPQEEADVQDQAKP